MTFKKTLFSKTKNKRIAKIININNPTDFKKRISV